MLQLRTEARFLLYTDEIYSTPRELIRSGARRSTQF